MLNTDPDFHQKLAEYRRKAADNTITPDEMREAVKFMRQGRVSAAIASEKSRAKRTTKTSAQPDADAMLSELEGL